MVIEANLVTAQSRGMSKPQDHLIERHGLVELKPERIGYRMRVLREALGLKPSEIADMLGIERTYWSRFENGTRPVTPVVQALLRQRFGVSLDYLILGDWSHLPHDLALRMRDVESRLAGQGTLQ